MTKNIRELIDRVTAIAPPPHTASKTGDQVVIVGSNGRVLGWLATTSGDWRAVAELWSLAPTVIQALTRRTLELEDEVDVQKRVARIALTTVGKYAPIVEAAKAYRTAVANLDGVQAAEQALFKALEGM